MAKYKITVPEGTHAFTGLGAGDVPFLNGVAETENDWFASWYESVGYTVEKVTATRGK